MVTIAQCQRLQTAWLAALATATGGKTFSTHGNTWVWLPARRELAMMFPPSLSAHSVRPALAEGMRLGAATARVWLNGAVDPSALGPLGFSPGWQPWWMAAPVSAVGDQRDGDQDGGHQDGDRDGDRGEQDGADEAPGSSAGDRAERRAVLTADVPDYRGPLEQELRVVRSQPRQAWHAVTRDPTAGNITGAAYSFYPAGVTGLRGLGGIHHLEVLPAYQRRGLATALLSTTARAAQVAGAEHLAVNATPQGYEFFSRRGFTLLGRGRTLSMSL